MRYVPQLLQQSRQYRTRFSGLADSLRIFPKNIFGVLAQVKNIGVSAGMSAVERSKLQIFNRLNFFQFVTGVLVPFVGLIYADKFPVEGWVFVCLPALVSVFVLVLNNYHRHELALLTYFVLYPFFICINYINGISLGIELSFILYGILSVFFIQDIGYMIFSICFSIAACKNNEAKVEAAATDSAAGVKPVEVKKETQQVNTQTVSQPVAQPVQKKGMSNAAKGAVIGGATGAVGGAIVDKNHRVQGAVIGAAVGAGAGYLIGKHKDKKKKRTTPQ